MRRVGVKFCGGCNPSIDRARVFQAMRDLAPEITFAGLQETGLEALLVICGCQTICPVEELGLSGHPKAIVVAGEMSDGRVVSESALPAAAVERLRQLLRDE